MRLCWRGCPLFSSSSPASAPIPALALLLQVREQGESAAVMNMMDALTGCLAKGGCFVVPGLTMDHYAFTLALSIAGGVIAGSAAKLEPSGEVAPGGRQCPAWVGTGRCGAHHRCCSRGGLSSRGVSARHGGLDARGLACPFLSLLSFHGKRSPLLLLSMQCPTLNTPLS